MPTYATPGVYREEIVRRPAGELLTGVPAFLGFAAAGPSETPRALTLAPEFETEFGPPPDGGYLAAAVRGFFANGGRLCYVVRLAETGTPEEALDRVLGSREPLASLATVDLICAPDIMRDLALFLQRQPGERPPAAIVEATQRMQAAVLQHCDDRGDRFALLDALPRAGTEGVLGQRQRLDGQNGALYYPWVRVPQDGFVPPCGHVAGVYARSDRAVGVHKAPANEVLEGVLDLEADLGDLEQGVLNPEGVNCLRAFPGRGIRVWGGRTLSREPAWRYVNVRRLFLTAGRWIERNMASVALEPNVPQLWARIGRELTAYFDDQFRRGALMGRTAQEAFYVKCDAETNPPAVRDLGQVIAEIGLAPALPNEFVVVHIISGPDGVTITGPTPPGPT